MLISIFAFSVVSAKLNGGHIFANSRSNSEILNLAHSTPFSATIESQMPGGSGKQGTCHFYDNITL